METTYSASFTYPPADRELSDLLWDQKLASEVNNIIPQADRYQDDLNYFENYSTSYDLSYNHFPKCLGDYKIKTPPRRQHFKINQKANDYLYSFGNITKYGLRDYFEEKWQYETSRQNLTNYRDTFIAPDVESYRFKRCAIPV